MANTKLSVNLNKVALLRNARNIGIPSVVTTAEQCIEAGAHGITVHPRPDERHIRADDVAQLAELLQDHKEIEYNVEGNPFSGMLEMARRLRPTQCTLVPDEPDQATSDHGWDIARDGRKVAPVIRELQALGIRVALFMDPDITQIELLGKLQPDRLELYTEPYAAAAAKGQAQALLPLYQQAAQRAQQLGMGVNAGHDLNLDNLPALLRIPDILECSIGHALIADALQYGLRATVRKYLAVLATAEPKAT